MNTYRLNDEKHCHICQREYRNNELCSVCGCSFKENDYIDATERISYKAWFIGNSLYSVYEAMVIDSDWLDVKRVYAGMSECAGEPYEYYVVSKDNMPYLTVGIYHDYVPAKWHGYTLWHNYLLIARWEDFYYIDVVTHEVYKFPKNEKFGYTGHFYRVADGLLVTSSSELYRFDENMSLVWQTEELAVDGVLVHDYSDGYLRVSGCQDPPYEWGWDKYKIDFATGEIIEGRNRWKNG